MPSIISQLDAAFRQAIRAAFDIDADPIVGLSQSENFGDYQSNAAMSLARLVSEKTGQKTSPRAVAEQIRARLNLGNMATEVTIAGPGFINVRLNPQWLAEQLLQAAADPRLGIPKTTSPQTVVVDYSGPNIAKQMHVGHLRSTIIGDAISRVLEFQGHNVIRQNHIGDWGTQFGMLIAYLLENQDWRNSAVHLSDLEEFYRRAKKRFDEDPAFEEESRQIVVRLQRGDPEILEAWRWIVNESRRHFQPIYQRLGVKLRPEDERGESFYNPMLPEVVRELLEKGIAVESEGAVVVFIDGPDKSPLIIRKSDGGYLYGTTDLAAIRYRVNVLHADRIIYTHDSRQAQHFSQVFRTAQKASWTRGDAVKLEFAPFGTMLGEDGKPFKTRSGDTVKLADLLDEAEQRAYRLVTEKNPDLPEAQRRAIARAVGIGGVKYADLSKDRTSDYVFSWEKMLALDGNTAPYLQYAYARIRSIFRKAGTDEVRTDVLILQTPHEIALAKHLLRLCEVIDAVARDLKPHLLCTYLYELATRFSGFYENCPVLQSEQPLRSSRLLLADLTARTLALGLDLLGIEHPEQM
ncbi:arginine--tRNA ligase [Fontivita pretiosa]|uniref:arginine--tRNA ligase n=1 Tax=Fontivita pretiosa TaxID=2989684 RepID=UPI003D170BF2